TDRVHDTSSCFCITRAHMATSLFPYTTLFRSSRLTALFNEQDRERRESVAECERVLIEIQQTLRLRDGVRVEVERLLDLDQHPRSEEHTSELQSRGHLVCALLVEDNNGCVAT